MQVGKLMDDKDKLLITLLKKDARRPIVALARDLGLSRTATQARLQKLIANGAISKFTLVEGDNVRDRQAAYLLIKLQPGFKCAQVVPKLKIVPVAVIIHSLAGDYDIIVQVEAPSIQAVEDARANIVAINGIADVTTMVTLQRHLN
jgi:Lrp/AsnC family transcriptional regulator, leucine-responsive regulatory protein